MLISLEMKKVLQGQYLE